MKIEYDWWSRSRWRSAHWLSKSQDVKRRSCFSSRTSAKYVVTVSCLESWRDSSISYSFVCAQGTIQRYCRSIFCFGRRHSDVDVVLIDTTLKRYGERVFLISDEFFYVYKIRFATITWRRADCINLQWICLHSLRRDRSILLCSFLQSSRSIK